MLKITTSTFANTIVDIVGRNSNARSTRKGMKESTLEKNHLFVIFVMQGKLKELFVSTVCIKPEDY